MFCAPKNLIPHNIFFRKKSSTFRGETQNPVFPPRKPCPGKIPELPNLGKKNLISFPGNPEAWDEKMNFFLDHNSALKSLSQKDLNTPEIFPEEMCNNRSRADRNRFPEYHNYNSLKKNLPTEFCQKW